MFLQDAGEIKQRAACQFVRIHTLALRHARLLFFSKTVKDVKNAYFLPNELCYR